MVFGRWFLRETLVISLLQVVLSLFVLDGLALKVSWVLYVAFLLLPANIRLLPPSYQPASYYKDLAEKLPRTQVPWSEATSPCGPATNEQYVIVGGSGFVGARIAHALLERNETKVRIVDLDQRAMDAMQKRYGNKLEFVSADITKLDQITKAFEGAKCVFAPAAVVRYWENLERDWPKSYKINVLGTKNIIDACNAVGVERLIITSSSSAVETWPGNIPEGINELTPRCTSANALSNYCRSKSEQEEITLNANGLNGLATGCIRPCSAIFGYGSRFQLQIALERGTYPMINPDVLIDFVHVDCIVLGHLLLERRLRNGPYDAAAGRSFCIAGDGAVKEGVFASLLAQYCPKPKHQITMTFVPCRLVTILSLFVTGLYRIFSGDLTRFLGKEVGILTFTTLLTGTHHAPVTNSHLPRDILGYEPPMSLAAAVEKTMMEIEQGRPIL